MTVQRGSAWHGYIGRLLFKEQMRFSTSRPGKTNEFLELNLADVIKSIRTTNSPNQVQIGCELAPPHGGEI